LINLGTLNQVEGFTFAYSGTLELGDRKFIVVAFETSPRSGKSHFDIKLVESKEELDLVVKTFQQKLDEPKPKKTFDWSTGKEESHLTPTKPKTNKTLDMFQ
jgi:hypothetical protein